MPLSPSTVAAIGSLPWCIAPAVFAVRMGGSPSLDDAHGGIADIADIASAPRVSIVLPARNEAAHIAECVRTLRASTWPDLEIIIVDDNSTDDTEALATAAADGDPRVRVLRAPPLPDGWFGKQWACHTGVQAASGSLLLFTDADTRHAPELLARMVATRAQRGAELLSVAGHQEAGTLWERAVQPLVFAMIMTRYGGARALERARRASDVVANGQCFLLSRASYDTVGGHEAVRDFVAEDVMIAQAVWVHGFRVSMALGVQHLRTRMYDGFGSLVRGWSKNMYAGGRHAALGGRIGRALFPIVLIASPLLMLLPFVLLAATPFVSPTLRTPLLWWSVPATAGTLLMIAFVHRLNRDPVWRALLAPLGAVVLLGICAFAVARGDNVRWKDRGYRAR